MTARHTKIDEVQNQEPETHSNESEAAGFLDRIGKSLSLSANVSTIFGHAVNSEGVTIIPVAKAAYGFGGGGGTQQGQSGGGGGGGVRVAPMGYIEIKDGSAKFHAIRDPLTLLPALAAGSAIALMAVRWIAKLLRD